jgi:hypothetical protein
LIQINTPYATGPVRWLVVFEELTASELLVLKAIFQRGPIAGYVPIDVPPLDPRSVVRIVGRLFSLGLIDAVGRGATPNGPELWIPGDVTDHGKNWLATYGMKRPCIN